MTPTATATAQLSLDAATTTTATACAWKCCCCWRCGNRIKAEWTSKMEAIWSWAHLHDAFQRTHDERKRVRERAERAWPAVKDVTRQAGSGSGSSSSNAVIAAIFAIIHNWRHAQVASECVCVCVWVRVCVGVIVVVFVATSNGKWSAQWVKLAIGIDQLARQLEFDSRLMPGAVCGWVHTQACVPVPACLCVCANVLYLLGLADN